MLLTNTILQKCYKSNIEHFINLGYSPIKVGESFDMNVLHLPHSSKHKISVSCDYCSINYEMTWDKYYKNVFNNIYCNKVSCKSCSKHKSKEVLLRKYGVNNPSYIESAKNKRLDTFMRNYGTDNPSKSTIIKDKKISTTRRKYGVDNPFQIKEIIDLIAVKKAKMMFENNGQMSSKQQNYIGKLYNGMINMNVDRYNLDICLPLENIYVEYDGSGHKLSMIFNNLSESEFIKVEQNRYYFLKNRGWKMMRILPKDDNIPDDSILLKMLDIGRKFLIEHSWINFDIDNNLYETSIGIVEFDYGKLKKFAKKRSSRLKNKF